MSLPGRGELEIADNRRPIRVAVVTLDAMAAVTVANRVSVETPLWFAGRSVVFVNVFE
jgi:hypothetical protein